MEKLGDLPRGIKLIGHTQCLYRGALWTAMLLSPFAKTLQSDDPLAQMAQVAMSTWLTWLISFSSST